MSNFENSIRLSKIESLGYVTERHKKSGVWNALLSSQGLPSLLGQGLARAANSLSRYVCHQGKKCMQYCKYYCYILLHIVTTTKVFVTL